MKFFKHFTDAHRGKSIQGLMDELGHMGLTYWILVEMCVEKLGEKLEAKGPGARLSKDDCEFDFHQRIVRQNLRIGGTNLRRMLDQCSTFDLLSYKIDGNIIKIKMPNILKSLERTKKKDVRLTSDFQKKDVLDIDTDIDTDKDINKEIGTDWQYEAEACFRAVRKFNSNAQVLEWLGDTRRLYIEDLGGVEFIRSLKQNSFEAKRLAELIRYSWNQIQSDQAGA